MPLTYCSISLICRKRFWPETAVLLLGFVTRSANVKMPSSMPALLQTFSAKQKPTAYGAGYVQLAMPA
jgi:hypothetical protein